MTLTPALLRTDAGIKCGASHIARGKKCHNGASPEDGPKDHSRRNRALAAGALAAAGLAAGAYAFHRGRKSRAAGPDLSIVPVRVGVGPARVPNRPQLPGRGQQPLLAGTKDPVPPALPGLTPKGLLPPRPPRISKTQRLRNNTRIAMRQAERSIARAAQAEVTRAGAVANAMASTGEATGMAAKSAFRGVRLRAEALRRRYEPGYRSPDPIKLPKALPEAPEPVFQVPFSPPRRKAPERVRRAKRDNYIETYAPVVIDPARRTDAGIKCGGGYIAQGKKCKNGSGTQAPPSASNRNQRLKTAGKVALVAGGVAAAALGGRAALRRVGTSIVKERLSAMRNERKEQWTQVRRANRHVKGATIWNVGKKKAAYYQSLDNQLQSRQKQHAQIAQLKRVAPQSPARRRKAARRDANDDGKKYTKVVTNPETGRQNKVRYGAKGYKIAPGTDKGDRYCARSFGDMHSEGYNCSGAERNTPLCLSRAKWKCSGKTSRRDAR